MVLLAVVGASIDAEQSVHVALESPPVAELAFFALPVELLDRRPWAGPATTAPVPAPNSAAPNAAATAFRMFIMVSSPFSTDVELLAAALGAAVVRTVGVSGVGLVVLVLANAAVALMGTN